MKTLLRFYKSMAIGFVFTAFVLALVNICPAQSLSSTEIDEIAYKDVIEKNEDLLLKRELMEAEEGEIIDIYPTIFTPNADYSLSASRSYTTENIVLGTDNPPPLTENCLQFRIADVNNAGSDAEYIYLAYCSSGGLKARLWGIVKRDTAPDRYFPRNSWMSWDLTPFIYQLNMSEDCWDNMKLQTVSTDGMNISYIRINHYSEMILTWYSNTWLDYPSYSNIDMTNSIRHTKLARCNNPTHLACYTGALELGKHNNGVKYGAPHSWLEWCSEFASWCQRNAGLDTPTGSINADDMVTWYRNIEEGGARLWNQWEILHEQYIPEAGDYISFWNEKHSGIFLRWIDNPYDGIDESTRFKTLEGNSSLEGNAANTVHLNTRTVNDISHIGQFRANPGPF